MKTFLCAFALILSFLGYGQSKPAIVSGSVVDARANIISNATVSLFSAKDSSLIKAELSDSIGRYVFTDIAPGEYFLVATAVAFEKTVTETMAMNVENLQVTKQIVLQPLAKTLQGVTVEAVKPFVDKKIDRTIINVASSVSNAGTSALEVLEKSPGVTVDKDGNVSMAGKQKVLILLDGRPTYISGAGLTDMLKNMPASTLDQIEIMTNPPSKFDATGNSGVINIKTKKTKSKGVNGSVSNSFGYSDEFRTNHSLNLNYRKGKTNLFGNYSYSLWQGNSNAHFIRNFRNEESNRVETIFDQVNQGAYRSDNHSIKAGLDYDINRRTVIGMVVSGFLRNGYSNGINTNSLNNEKNEPDSLVIATSHSDRFGDNVSINFNIRHSFDSTGKDVTADLDYLNYYQNGKQLLATDYFLPNGQNLKPSSVLKGSLPSSVAIYSARADFTLPLKTGMKLEAGIKSSYVITDNDALYQNQIDKEFIIDYNKTNHFIYKENVNAAYVNFSKEFKKWGAQAGLRAENTNATGHQLGNSQHKDSSFTKNYLNLFPTIFLSFKANKSNTLSANYGRRINRPAYEDLNPFLYFLDEFTYQVGNTLLQPEFTNNIEFSHNFKGRVITTLNYSHTFDAFTEILKQNNSERKTFQTKENISTKTSYGLAVNFNIPVTSFWNSVIYTNLSNTKYSGPLNGKFLNVENTGFIANVNNQLKFTKGWDAELSGFYRSKSIEGQIVIHSIWRADAGIQKQILKDRGALKFSVRDVFNSQNFSGYIHYDNIDLSIMNTRINRTFSLTFSYRFGKPVKNQKLRKSGGAEEEKSRVNTSNQ